MKSYVNITQIGSTKLEYTLHPVRTQGQLGLYVHTIIPIYHFDETESWNKGFGRQAYKVDKLALPDIDVQTGLAVCTAKFSDSLLDNKFCSPHKCACVQPCTVSCCTVGTWWRKMWFDECWPRSSVRCSWWDSECWLAISSWILIGMSGDTVTNVVDALIHSLGDFIYEFVY